jgi:hypothetical protein
MYIKIQGPVKRQQQSIHPTAKPTTPWMKLLRAFNPLRAHVLRLLPINRSLIQLDILDTELYSCTIILFTE